MHVDSKYNRSIKSEPNHLIEDFRRVVVVLLAQLVPLTCVLLGKRGLPRDLCLGRTGVLSLISDTSDSRVTQEIGLAALSNMSCKCKMSHV